MRNASVLEVDKTPSEPSVEANQAPVGVARRVGAFLLRELREMLPPTIFFFIAFNLILLTTNLLVANYGAAFGSFMLVTGGALVVGKAVLVANATQSIRRYDRAPLPRHCRAPRAPRKSPCSLPSPPPRLLPIGRLRCSPDGWRAGQRPSRSAAPGRSRRGNARRSHASARSARNTRPKRAAA